MFLTGLYYVVADYTMAQQKLKAEKLSNLSSNMEKEKYLKKTKKIINIKLLDSNSDELSDDNSIKSLSPPIKKRFTYLSVTKKQKIAKNAQEGNNNTKT